MSTLAKSKAKGKPILGVRLDLEIKKLLFVCAESQGVNASELARRILAAHLLKSQQ